MNRVFLSALLLFALAASAEAKLRAAALRLPPELDAVPRWEVQGRQGWKLLERLSFGDYRVHAVERSLTRGGDLQILFYEGSQRRQTFGFTLSEQGAPRWRGAAATNLRRRALDVGIEIEVRHKSGFAAQLRSVDDPGVVWTLDLNERSARPLAGTLSRGGRNVLVKGTNALAGSRLPFGETTGYLFTETGRTLAAVEVLNDGAVWLAPDIAADLRGPVTAAIAALLLLEELRPTLPE